MNGITKDVDATCGTPVPRPVVTPGYARTLGISELASVMIVTDTSFTPYGADLVFDGRVEYPITPAKAVESEEGVGCVAA
jgi:hypothetical protein